MSRERFVEVLQDAVLSLPQDMKAVLRIVDDRDVNDEGRIAAAGALMHVLAGSNAIPGIVGLLGYVDDALVLRLVLERIEKDNTEAIARHREDSPELFEPLGDQLEATRAYLGDLISVLEAASANVHKLQHQGHNPTQCATDEDEATWLYDAVQEAIVDQLEFDEDEVARELRQIDKILPPLKSRVASKS